MASRFGRTLSALALLATPALAQDFNNLDLNNGGDGIFFYNDPGVGNPPNSFPITNYDVDFWYRVYPKEAFHHPLGTLEVTGFTNEYYDTDWVATPNGVTGITSSMHDMILTPGIIQGDGTMAPDLPGAPNPLEVDIVGLDITGLLTNPCPAAGVAGGCASATSVCPATGFVVGYIIGLDFGGAGPVLQADEFTDWTWSTFVPGVAPAVGGMTLAGGSCGTGDYILQDVHSSNVFGNGELQADLLGNGFSRYGGFQVGGTGAGAWNPDLMDEVYAEPLEFGTAISEPVNDVGLGPQTGLAALNPSVGGGANTLGMRYWSASAAGELAFFFASTFPLLPRPGIALLDINILVNIADPLAGTIAGIWAGFIVGGLGTFADDGIFDSVQIPLPPILVGFSLQVQGFNFDLVSDFDNSQALVLPMQP
jgi:hypothetical protein